MRTARTRSLTDRIMTSDLDLQSQAGYGHDPNGMQKVKFRDTKFKSVSSRDRVEINGQTDGWS